MGLKVVQIRDMLNLLQSAQNEDISNMKNTCTSSRYVFIQKTAAATLVDATDSRRNDPAEEQR